MSHTTLGIDIKSQSIRYAVCNFSNGGIGADIREYNTVAIQPTETSDGFSEALAQISKQLENIKGLQIDNIGLLLDPTLVLSAHRTLPFNDPKTVEKILPQDLNDVWKLDGSSQIAFQVGDKVKMQAEEGEESEEGYDILAINFPYEPLSALLEKFKNSRIDPHLAIPTTYALPYALGTFIKPPEETWAIIDIGEKSTIIACGIEGKIELMRAIKVGSSSNDETIASFFNLTPEDAKRLKEATGFVALPQQETATYQMLVNARAIDPYDIDPITLSRACTQGMEVLINALRQTMVSFSSKFHTEPECFYLTGGGARLRNLATWLSQLAGVPCYLGVPLKQDLKSTLANADEIALDICAPAVAAAAAANADNNCPLNLRKGALAHKGNLAFLQDNKWMLAAIVFALIAVLIFMTSTRAKAVQTEHDKIKQALEESTNELFGKKMLSKQQISKEIEESAGYDFLPEKTAFTHFSWISNNVNDNLADIEMDLSSLDIDTQRKIVTIKGEVAGDDGLPRFMQLLEQYECFPDEIQEPKTTKVKEKTSFTLRVDANHCAMGGDSE